MEVVDLVDEYVADVLRDRDFDRYERHMPELFAHIREYWNPRWPRLDEAVLLEQREIVRQVVDRTIGKVRETADPDRIGVLLFAGADGTGHAFEHAGRVWAWLPVEAYTSELTARAFVPHELAHAAQYAQQPELFFRSRAERASTGRQIISEGFAMRMAMEWESLSAADALWADFVTEFERSSWLVQCGTRRTEMARHILDCWDQDAGDLFYSTGSGDVLGNRGGYEIALAAWMAAEKASGASAAGLMTLPRHEIERLLKAELDRMAAAVR
jgi:hypothetical protein